MKNLTMKSTIKKYSEIVTKQYVSNYSLKKFDGISPLTDKIVKIKFLDENKRVKVGTGFLLEFKLGDNPKFHALITNNHIITINMILKKWEIKLFLKRQTQSKFLKLDESRIIFSFCPRQEDVTIVEIKEEDNIIQDLFMKIDEIELFKDKNSLLYQKICIYHYPSEENIKNENDEIIDIDLNSLYYSDGELSKIYEEDNPYNYYYCFGHNARTLGGSSGAPIILCQEINGDKIKVIGIHKGLEPYENINCGTFLGHVLEKINKQRIQIIVEVNEEDIEKEIYFLGRNWKMDKYEYYNELENSKTYIDGEINDEKTYLNHFKFEEKGEHIIEYEYNENIENYKYMFSDCKNIKSIKFINVKTDNVKDMRGMFYGCVNLTSIIFPITFKTQNVKNMSKIFDGCPLLKNIQFPIGADSNVIISFKSKI